MSNINSFGTKFYTEFKDFWRNWIKIFVFISQYEERQITVVMEPGDSRFGFSVIGGIDEGFLPRVDDVARGINHFVCF